mgnify:CR=1 FL=1
MEQIQLTVGEKIKLACGTAAVAVGLTLASARLYSLRNVPPITREPAGFVVVSGSNKQAAQILNIPEKILANEIASGYSSIKRKQVAESQAAIIDSTVSSGIPAFEIMLPPLQLEAIRN